MNSKTFTSTVTDLELIQLALTEDLGQPFCDLTTQTLFEQTGTGRANIISKHVGPIIFCGQALVKAMLEQHFQRCTVEFYYQDGDTVAPYKTILQLEGSAQELLMLERTLLNFLQRLCAIATLTAHYVEQIQHTHAQLLDTRKTTPGMRHLEKYAVLCGGGVNHRMGLYDAIMVKDTHIDMLGSLEQVLHRLRQNQSNLGAFPVIIEVRNLLELKTVLQHGQAMVTRVLLDNMTLEEMRACVELCRGKLATEASGNVSLDTIKAIAETGVDFISVGKITHSAGVVDLSMRSDASP